MKHYQYLIIGGGMTADAAVAGIHQVDPVASIGLFSAETHPPYNRPPLSKGLWKGKPLEKIFRQASRERVDLHLRRTIQAVNPATYQVTDDLGETFTYSKLLLATGGSPRRLPVGSDKVIYFRDLEDYFHLQRLVEQGSRFGVIGGGFIGAEIAAVLASKGQPVTMLFPEENIAARLLPPDLADFVTNYYRQRNVEVLSGEMVSGIENDGSLVVIQTQSGKEIRVDSVIAGLGIKPNTALAEAAGIKVVDGIVVDNQLRTDQPDIYAAGDVAYFYNQALDRWMRVEHEDNALSMGLLAGRNMAGDQASYDHLPVFYSDLFDLGYEAVGELDPSLEIFADWQDRYRKGVVYYLHAGRVRGVLLWNVWDQVDSARGLIADPGPFDAGTLRGRIT
jgi:NADPH-dependent 2,4-dienoyl-CoA reductase/sulfur reductase-like enzyme